MVELHTSQFPFKKKQFWFADKPFDVPCCAAAYFYAVPHALDIDGFERYPSPTFIIDLKQDSETLKKAMSKNCRYEVNRAQRDGLIVKKNQDQQAFFDIYRQFVKEKDFAGDLNAFWDFVERGNLYTCYYNDMLLGGLLTLEDDDNSRWLLSGSIRLVTDDSEQLKRVSLANRLVIWEAMLDARSRGLHSFDLGGYYDGEDRNHPGYGIAKFKRAFGGEPVVQYKYAKVYSLPLRLIKNLKALR